MTSDVVCLFHDDCFDGLGAAWSVSKKFPDAQFVSVKYGQPPPNNLLGKVVYVVDFCYPLEVLQQIGFCTEELHVFDHHKDKEEIIASFNDLVSTMGWNPQKFRGVYDNDRSGAKLTWEMLFPTTKAPELIEFIGDWDLYRFELADTKAVIAGLSTYPLELSEWQQLFHPNFFTTDTGASEVTIGELKRQGLVVLRKTANDVLRVIKTTQRDIVLGGYRVPLINAPRTMVSEALAHLVKDQPFAASYFDSEHLREFSLRSNADGIDVIPIAKRFGGGGHKHAAAFSVPRNHFLAQY